MKSVSTFLAGGVVLLALTGCASFTAKPIAPAATASALEQRSLKDPTLRSLVSTAMPERAGAIDAATWDLSSLTVAALYFHPDMEIARSKLSLARAGVTTAGQIPNPTLSFSPTQHGVIVDPSPWTVGLLVNLVLELGGKREKRIDQAKSLVEAARQDLATASWQVRGTVRSSMLDLWAAEGRRSLNARRQSVQEQVVAILDRRFSAGDASALDVARERIALSQARLATREAERQAADARVRLATAVGVPVRAIDGIRPSLTAFDQPAAWPELSSISAGPLRQRALQERTDVLGLLAEYNASQNGLRLEVAKQYPDINLGPGYTYDQGDELYNFGISAEIPLFNQNQGQIAEAKGRRSEAAARFVGLQAKIIGEIDRSVAAYRSSDRSLATTDEMVRVAQRRSQQITRSVQLGEADKLTALTAEMERATVDLARFDALVQQREALASIEDAVQQPIFDTVPGAFAYDEQRPTKLEVSK